MLPPKKNLSNSFPSGPSKDDIESFVTAAKNGDVSGVERYLDQFGATIVNAQDNINARAITWAAWGGCDEVIKVLLTRGAEIDAHGTDGKTALSWAAQMGKLETFALLMDRGAKLDDRDNNGLTPADHARNSSNTAIADLVNQYYEEIETRKHREEDKKVRQAEHDAREAVEERLRKLKDGAGKIKIQPQSKKRGGPGHK
jgi:ankyrin repeat protein